MCLRRELEPHKETKRIPIDFQEDKIKRGRKLIRSFVANIRWINNFRYMFIGKITCQLVVVVIFANEITTKFQQKWEIRFVQK